jgi:hypothetical protein
VQVCLHELEDQVEIAIVACADDTGELNDVGVFELGEDGDLSVGALGVSGVLKGVEYLFKGVGFVGTAVDGLPDVAVGSTAQQLLGLEEMEDVLVDFLAHGMEMNEFIKLGVLKRGNAII